MARTTQQVQDIILDAIQDDENLAELNSSSTTALYRLFARVVAKGIVTLETLFDVFSAQVTTDLANQKAHTLQWYRNKALAFQLGYELQAGNDIYTVSGTAETIAAQIIAYAAVVDQDGTLIVKANKEDGGSVPLDAAEFAAFFDYMSDIKDAGVALLVRNVNPDRLKLIVDIYYDPTVISSNGARLDGQTATPVKDGVDGFLAAVPFDGRFVKSHLVDALQRVPGVKVPVVRSCQVARFDSASFSSVDVDYDPFAGFLRIYEPADLVLNYIAYV